MENQYTQIVRNFLGDNPQLFRSSGPAIKAELANDLATEIASRVRELTPALAEPEMTPLMTAQQREGITNMARLRAEEIALHETLYSML